MNGLFKHNFEMKLLKLSKSYLHLLWQLISFRLQFMNYDRNIFINILEIENYYGVGSDASPVRQKRIFESRLP